MKTSFVSTFLLLQIVNICSSTEIQGTSISSRISQEKCYLYQNMFQPPAGKNFSFLVRIYNGYYLNGNLIIENGVKFLNGVFISEDFVLTIADNGTQRLLFVDVFDMQLEVAQKFLNKQRNIMLLKLSESIKFSDQIRPACLPQPQPIVLSHIICWVDDGWLNHIQLKLASRGSCKTNSNDYIKRLRIEGISNGTSVCTNIVGGDGDKCNVAGAIVLNDNQEVVGVATESEFSHLQIFVQLSEHVLWIEDVVWPSKIISSTTKETSGSESSMSTTYAFDYTTVTTPNSNATKPVGQLDVELHDIHLFLNVNLILIVVILFLVLCISSILWSDGLCIRDVLSNQFSMSTDV